MHTNLVSMIDHLVIAAPSLDAGIDYVYKKLGVKPVSGGKHIRMGTHNALLHLGDTTYLEILAIDPGAPPPGRPRWFELDTLPVDAAPKLLTWAARTSDIHLAAATAGLAWGDIEPMSRSGLDWLLTIPHDGALPYQGITPFLIQWLGTSHPASRLPPSRCSLVQMEGFHHQHKMINEKLQAIGFSDRFSVMPTGPQDTPYLVAHIQTPGGLIKLDSR